MEIWISWLHEGSARSCSISAEAYGKIRDAALSEAAAICRVQNKIGRGNPEPYLDAAERIEAAKGRFNIPVISGKPILGL